MPLTLLAGGAGAGKSRACYAAMAAALAAPEAEGPLILLVPEQATHFTEREALARLGCSHRVHVLSFRRLAWRVFQEVGGAARPPITELGRHLVLRAILGRRREELGYFGRMADRPGLLSHLSRTLRECRSHLIGPGDLRAAAAAVGGGRADLPLPAKLRDLALLMSALEEHMEGRYSDPDQALTRLAAGIGESDLVRGAEFWLDGFSGFTPQEYQVLASILAAAGHVTVTLCLDAAGPPGLFAPTLDTRERLVALAMEANHAVAERIPDPAVAGGGAFAPAIAHLARAMFEAAPRAHPDPAPEVTLARAPDPRAEVGAIAREILRLCRHEGYRFRDMAVMVRDLEAYHPLFAAVFAEHGIPAFMDRRRPVAYHALVELVRAAVEAAAADWPYEAVFRFLKSDLAGASRQDVDRLENLVLEFGIRGARRWMGQDWPGPPWLRELRDRATGALAEFHRHTRGRRPLRTLCEALYGMLETLGVPERLAAWAADAEAAGDLAAAAEHLQVHDAILDLLDQTVEALGDVETTCEEWLPVLEAGLADLRLGLVPPALDQVIVGTVERSRHPALRAAFVAGATEGMFPRAAEEDLVLDDAERSALAAVGFEVGPTSRDLVAREPFALYVALTRATERLILTFPEGDAGGRGQVASRLWLRTAELVPGCRRLEPAAAGDLDAVATVGQAAQVVATALASGARATESPWCDLLAWFDAEPVRREAARAALGGLTYRNAAGPLPGDLAAALFGPDLLVSASRLETMAACPFRYLMQHALRLVPRPLFRVEPVDVGRFLHEALERLVSDLAADGADLGELPPADSDARVARAVAAAAGGLDGSAMLASGQGRHLVRKLERALGHAAGALGEHARRGRFRPAGVEVDFGPRGSLPALDLAVRDGRRVAIQGRIDRVDACAAADCRWILVVDYKRAARDLALDEVHHGLALQLAVYLAVATRHGAALAGLVAGDAGRLRPAGMLYFPVQPAWKTLDGPPEPEKAERETLKSYKARGLLAAEAARIGLFDAEPGWSPVVPLRLTKAGQVVESQSRVADAARLDALLAHALAEAARLGDAILDGVADIAPYRLRDRTPCGTCDYRPVCRFDPDAGEAWRYLPALDP